MEKIFIDASGTPIGRIGSYTVKQALLGNKIFILNSEKAIISGRKTTTIDKYKERRAKGGSALKGPYHSKEPEKVLKRSLRGMLPDHRQGRGREAWKRIMCYIGVPKEYEKEKLIKIKTKKAIKYITLKGLQEKL